MAQYGRVDISTWNDSGFRSLSAAVPCGQMLWLYLLAPRERKLIPGLVPAGVGTIAESLRWPYEATRTALDEILGRGMAEEDTAGPLIWLPNALGYNPPDNPNVLKSWGAGWVEIPECPLKLKAWEALRAATEPRSEAFAGAFRAAFPRPLGADLAPSLPGKVTHKPTRKRQGKRSAEPSREPSTEGRAERLGEHQHQHQHQQEAAAAARAREAQPEPAAPPPAAPPAPQPDAPPAAVAPESPGPASEPATSVAAQANASSGGQGPAPRPAARRGPVVDDDPPPRKLLVLDGADLGPLGAELVARVEVEIKRGLAPPKAENRAQVREELEQLLEKLGDMDRCVSWVATTILGREGSGATRVHSVTLCLAFLRSMPLAKDPLAAARAACPEYAAMLQEIERRPGEFYLSPGVLERWLATLKPTLRTGVLELEAEDRFHVDLVEQLFLAGMRRLAVEVIAPHVVVNLTAPATAPAAKEA